MLTQLCFGLPWRLDVHGRFRLVRTVAPIEIDESVTRDDARDFDRLIGFRVVEMNDDGELLDVVY